MHCPCIALNHNHEPGGCEEPQGPTISRECTTCLHWAVDHRDDPKLVLVAPSLLQTLAELANPGAIITIDWRVGERLAGRPIYEPTITRKYP